MNNKISAGIIDSKKQKDSLNTVLKSLDSIVMVIIITSSLLSFVVLYNLTNINIEERNRELSTIKVLGFYTKELTAYIYREIFILSIIGIMIGFYYGKVIYHYILSAIVSSGGLYMDSELKILNFIISAVVIIFFTLLIMIITHFRLKRINMVESLKAPE